MQVIVQTSHKSHGQTAILSGSGGKCWSLPPDLPPVVSINISDVTWVLRCLKSLATQLFIQQLVQGNIKEKFYITGHVQEESTMTGGFLSQRASNT